MFTTLVICGLAIILAGYYLSLWVLQYMHSERLQILLLVASIVFVGASVIGAAYLIEFVNRGTHMSTNENRRRQ